MMNSPSFTFRIDHPHKLSKTESQQIRNDSLTKENKKHIILRYRYPGTRG